MPTINPNLLTLKYIPISEASLFETNATLHELEGIIASIKKYGFKNAPKWESLLNGGAGGIVAGNGRIEALTLMHDRGDSVPDGIAIDSNGEWFVPVQFGVDAPSEMLARAYAIDDNNLTVLGGEFNIADLDKLYDKDTLVKELESLSLADEMPVTMNNDALTALLKKLSQNENEDTEQLDSRDSSTKELNTDYDLEHTCPKCGFQF